MKRLLTVLHRIEDGVLVALLLAMILLAGVDILARTLFGGGVVWVQPLLRVMVLWIGLLGALLATRTREHIAIDLTSRLAGPALKRVLAVITSAFAAFVCGVIAINAKEFVKLAYEFGDVAFAQVPAWPLQLIIPISFALMSLRFAVQALAAAAGRQQEEAA
ncbi:TRAP transporter small permease [Thalassolituus sp. LLYu03]|uniref:TRAP transporter small permease n=1 Tax=Thalassolituus sp. LLYu03 TaxID=3421656 RepID=UPI003D2834B7